MKASEGHLRLCLRRLESEASPGELEAGEGLALALALRYGSETIRAVGLLVKNELRVQAFAVARGFIELSIRLLWAARAENGWNRFIGYFAAEDIKWAERLVSEFARSRSDFAILSSPEAAALAAVRPCMADIATLLREIQAADAQDHLTHGAGTAPQLYYGQFCFLHAAAHGSPTAIDGAGVCESDWNVHVFLANAAFGTMRAVYMYEGWESDALFTASVTELDRCCRAEGWAPPGA